ncbi:hypothetical protein PV08_07803 [Exophiala spinifera]|uniref:Sugar phosphate transporter domain-containing protein n=1 Tax=Exophiala spinifera TaxID=91928 RepID=A0A0D1YJB8_9EURO|nr:uncharacterized protein PV08_07803 [Exophiala spinifera]KIW15016.1 hypothetical protein PV08_07803 [Exophiala spinifera]
MAQAVPGVNQHSLGNKAAKMVSFLLPRSSLDKSGSYIDSIVERDSLSDSESSDSSTLLEFDMIEKGHDARSTSLFPHKAPSQRKSGVQQLVDAMWMGLNIFSTVIIVFLNKIVFSDPQLRHCQISVAIWHFTATTIVLYLSTRRPCNAFEAVRIPVLQVLPICIFFAGFLLLGNLSLALNDVDFYQLAKIMTAPTVVALNFVLFRKYISSSALIAVLVTCAGVGLVTAGSFKTNLLGTFVATAAFTVTALYQVWIGKKIEDLKVSPPQLLLNQAPASVVLLLTIVPFVDTRPDLSTIPSNVLYALFMSGIIASLLNLSQFFIIGRTSPLTFNVVSQVKTILILGLSWLSTGKQLTFVEIVGVAFALGGAYAYAQISRR